MASVSIENLLDGLSAEELHELSGDIDPSLQGQSSRVSETTRYFDRPRAAKNRYDIKSMICVMEQKSQDSVEGENYLPRKYRDWKKEEKSKKKREKPVEEEVKLPDELEVMMKDIGDEDINEIAAVLGLHSLLTQQESFAVESQKLGEAIKKFGLRKPGIVQGKRPKSMPDMLQTPDTIQISEILKRLKRSDPTLTEIAMNNYKDVESVLIDIARLLKKNTYVTKLSVANTQMKPAVCLHLIETMKVNRTLESINMESNYLTGDVIAKLMRVLEDNKTVKELRLANQACTSGSKSEQAIAKSLEANHALKRFGYFFETRGPMMSAAKSLLRNNDEARQKRRSFHELALMEDV
ncbi:tropomodulin-1 isoform X1 [Paramuricea clavata]|uniref:Tropomodulin-1 isoform X1 n=2 Tax=Paramuricea clavata TaxID=317549 RepID=A0A7D9IGW6_PARCT|nr:tropomodulin-1 isoform X1 [Paramuricea clavata]